MAVVLGVSFLVPWQSIRREWTLAFPLGLFVAIPVLSTGGHKLGATYAGFFVLCFAYTGLTQSGAHQPLARPAGGHGLPRRQ